jgi:chromosome transmission fidelity protein 1
MEPIDLIYQQLFSKKKEEKKIIKFQCDHVIPNENILPICLSSGPTLKEFDFTFKNRTNIEMVNNFQNF